MPNIGAAEIVIILVLALLVFGPKRLPQMGRSLGRGVREFKKAADTARKEFGVDEIEREIKDVKKSLNDVKGDLTTVQSELKSDLKVDLDAEVSASGKAAGAAAAAGGVHAAAGAADSAAHTAAEPGEAEPVAADAEPGEAEPIAADATPGGASPAADEAAPEPPGTADVTDEVLVGEVVDEPDAGASDGEPAGDATGDRDDGS